MLFGLWHATGVYEGIAQWERVIQMDPSFAFAHLSIGNAYVIKGMYPEAIEAFKQVRAPSFRHHAEIAGCHAQIGSDEEAKHHAAEVLRLKPDFSIAGHVHGLPFKEPRDRDQYRDGLAKAGLPE